MFAKIVLAAVTLALLGSTPAGAAYAIAFNPSSGRAAANNASFDLEQVKRAALSSCGRGCRIVASSKRSCSAVVEAVSTGTYAWAVANGTTTSTATNAAWHGCRQKGDVNCKTAAAICD